MGKTPFLYACEWARFHDNRAMKYYIWMDAEDRPLSKAWRYEDETERMAAERHPPSAAAVLRAGTREQLIEIFRLQEADFVDSDANRP